MEKKLLSTIILLYCFTSSAFCALSVSTKKAVIKPVGLHKNLPMVVAQSDTASILKKCLDHSVIQQYYTKNSDGTNKQVYIMQGPVKFSEGIVISKFNMDVLFRSRRDIYAENADDFFIFRQFEISNDTAIVIFNFNYNYHLNARMLELTLHLHKTGTNWEITNTQTLRLL